MSHAINKHDLTDTNPCINQAIHVLLIHSFVVLHMCIPGPSQKLTSLSVTCIKANVIWWCQNDVSIYPGSTVFKMLASNVPFRAIIGAGKDFCEAFSPKFSFLCNNSNQTCKWSVIICNCLMLGSKDESRACLDYYLSSNFRYTFYFIDTCLLMASPSQKIK